MKRRPSQKQIGSTLRVLRGYQKVLRPIMADKLNNSALFVDLADIYEISALYVAMTNRILREKRAAPSEEICDRFVAIQVELLEHLPYHIKSLRKTLPRVVRVLCELEEQEVRKSRRTQLRSNRKTIHPPRRATSPRKQKPSSATPRRPLPTPTTRPEDSPK